MEKASPWIECMLPSRRLTSPLEIRPGPKRKLIFRPSIFRGELLDSGRVFYSIVFREVEVFGMWKSVRCRYSTRSHDAHALIGGLKTGEVGTLLVPLHFLGGFGKMTGSFKFHQWVQFTKFLFCLGNMFNMFLRKHLLLSLSHLFSLLKLSVDERLRC